MRYLFTLAILLMATPCFAVGTKTFTVCEGGGCDYTTVQAAETALNRDLVAIDSAFIIEIQNTWASPDGQVQINGWTTDATRFLTIRAVGAAKAGATWSTTAYRATATQFTIDVSSLLQYTVIDGLQATTSITNTTNGVIIRGNAINVTVINCFVNGNSTAGATDVVGIQLRRSGSSAMVIRNNVVIDCAAKGIDGGANSGGIKVDNNTLENCGTGINTDFGDALARNNIIWNCTTPLSGTFAIFSEENYTDVGSLGYGACGDCGAGDQASQSDPFVSIAGEDYHLKSGATAIDAGKDLSADFTDDIDGDTRDANFDKGADEFIAAATGQKVMIRK